jgi:hypothetical protein
MNWENMPARGVFQLKNAGYPNQIEKYLSRQRLSPKVKL